MINENAYKNTSLFDHEQSAINQIENAIKKYNAKLLSNILLYDKQTQNYYEYDIIIIACSGIYVVELKHWTGNIRIEPYNWVVNQSHRPDPHKSNSFKCKLLKGIYQHKFNTYPNVWIPSFVVLTNPSSIVEGADTPSMLSVNLDKKSMTFSSIIDFIRFFRKRESSIENNILNRSQIETISNYFGGLNIPKQGIKYSIPGYETVEYLYQRPECIELVARPIGKHAKGLNRFRIFRIPYQVSKEEKERYEKKAYNTLRAVELIGDHPHILKVWVVENENGDIIEGSDWSEAGTLRDLMNRCKNNLAVDMSLEICRNILLALISAHEVEVVHRAVKPENILMMNGIPKLMNFDLSFQIDDGPHVTVIADTDKIRDDGYIAPEILKGKDIDEGTDFFSLGVIAYEMLTGSKPFSSTKEFIAKDGVLDNEFKHKLKKIGLLEKSVDTITAMLSLDRNMRPKDPEDILSAFNLKNVSSDKYGKSLAINPILELGSTYDVYEIIEFIGGGGETQVYKAKTVREKHVAIKLFNQEVSLERILKEDEIISTVNSSYMVRSENKIGHWNGERFFIVMEFINGETMRRKIDHGENPDIDTFKSISVSLMSAIESLHNNFDEDENEKPILHSDIKPENIVITPDMKPMLIDFGIAGEPRVDTFQGTDGYVPPDSIVGSQMLFSKDGDLFALGVTLWEWVYGKRPYENPAIGDIPENVDAILPDRVQRWMEKAIATRSSERFEDISNMKAAFIDSMQKTKTEEEPLEMEKANEKKEEDIVITNNADESYKNDFVTYLNTLSCSSAANSNATAESQIGNLYFNLLYVKNPLTDFIYNKIINENCNVVLTGNAGDGKTTIVADIFFRLIGDIRPLQKIEYVSLNNTYFAIIKDMSELPKNERTTILREAFVNKEKKYLIVSNTGMLIESFEKLKSDVINSDIESDLLRALESDKPELVFEDRFLVLNIGNTDSIDMVCEVFKRMISKENWDKCSYCHYYSKCHIYKNVCLIQENLEVVCERIKLLYRRLYEYNVRLTIRQMIGHLAYSLTAGRECNEITSMSYIALMDNLYGSLFFNRFFGDNGIEDISEAWQLTPIEKIYSAELGTAIDPLFERKAWTKADMSLPLTGITANIFNDLKSKAEQPELSVRRQMRRLLYFFGDLSDEDGKQYISNFLNSIMLQEYIDVTCSTYDMPPLFESKNRQKILQVLQEFFIGIRLPEGGWDIHDIYITLNRRELNSTTQIVLADFRVDEFKIIMKDRYNTSNTGCKKLFLVCKQGNVEMELDLPFLDFVAGRYEGEVAENLIEYYNDRLEQYKVKLLDAYKERVQSDEKFLRLLRIDTLRQFKIMKIIISNEQLEVL